MYEVIVSSSPFGDNGSSRGRYETFNEAYSVVCEADYLVGWFALVLDDDGKMIGRYSKSEEQHNATQA